MKMFSTDTYHVRRERLKSKMRSGLLLFLGNDESSINFQDNWYPFRQDSTFLYFFGLDIPGLAAIVDIDNNKEIIFGDDSTVEDSIWTGTVPRIRDLAARVGVDDVLPSRGLNEMLGRPGRRVHYLPPFRPENRQKLSEWLKMDLREVNRNASIEFVRSVASLRSHKSGEEIDEINRAVDITAEMQRAVMRKAVHGSRESALAGVAQGTAIAAGGNLSFPSILTMDGHVLHNHDHGNTLQDGRMVLFDGGAETEMHYAGDLTRTFPVGQRFSNQQREVYEIVFEAYRSAVASLRPGVLFRDVHLHACRKLADGLKAIGLMKGDLDDAVLHGAHAMFFPCGLGHMLGLDVHDMEDLGEQYVGYTEGLERSTQFGLKSLRLAKALERDFVITVEPGIYFIPELMDLWHSEGRHSDYIQYENLAKYRSLGGIRIEDDFVITDGGAQLLGKPLATTAAEIEEARSLNSELPDIVSRNQG